MTPPLHMLAATVLAATMQSLAFTVEEGPEWTAVDYRRDIESGSALDFSSLSGVEAPAGRYGWTKAVGGHLEFERRPGVPQRFYGVNLCMSMNFPSHEEAERLVARLRRMGYNAIRLHHHDRGTVAGSADGLALNEKNMERFDYLVATAIREGLYLATDLYVSRPVKWRAVGIDRDGEIPKNGYKALTALHEPAYRNWQTYASNFLFHVNGYTGRRFLDEPACVLLGTLNENWMSAGWKYIRAVPECEPAYAKWRAAKIAKYGSGFMEGSLKESFATLDPWRRNAATSLFFAEMEAAAFARNRAWLRSIGVKNLLCAGNHGPQNVPNQFVRSLAFDCVDDHSYEDHPEYLNKVKRYALPKRCGNRDYLAADAFCALSMNRKAFSRVVSKPFTVTEWNCCGPSEYRQAGGLYGGSLFARQDWSGVWRFAYAHDIRHLGDVPRTPGAFDVSADPIMAAQERQVVPLFLRRDLEPAATRVNFMIDDEALMPRGDSVLSANPSRKENLMFAARVSCGTDCVEGALNLRIAEYASGDRQILLPPGTENGGVEIDFSNRTFSVASARTCGVCGPEGARLRAGALEVVLHGTRAAVSVTSLDGLPIARSSRMLLAHLTDTKGRGSRFERTDKGLVSVAEGDGTILLRNGTAEIGLAVDDPAAYRVYALSTSGMRRFRVQAIPAAGRLALQITTRGNDGFATMEYEIVRER